MLHSLDLVLQNIVSVWIELEANGDVEFFATASDLFCRFSLARGGDDDGHIEPSNAAVASEEATGEAPSAVGVLQIACLPQQALALPCVQCCAMAGIVMKLLGISCVM